jgi:DNA-binding CsgD family transcriptional regulator
MGATTGLKLIADMREFAPDSIYMLLSGEADLDSALKAVNEAGVFRFFTKPARAEPLKLGVYEALREYNLRRMHSIANITLDAIEVMNAAIACVDLSGKILYANDPAEKLLENSGFFQLGPERELRSVVPAETKSFKAFLQDVASASDDAPARSVFRFSHPEISEPIVVSAVRTEGSASHVSLIIADPRRKAITSPEEIAVALNLTRSESRVVFGLVSGGSVDEAAETAGVSISSARTYLKNVFAKTGVSRQAELVRLVLLAAA